MEETIHFPATVLTACLTRGYVLVPTHFVMHRSWLLDRMTFCVRCRAPVGDSIIIIKFNFADVALTIGQTITTLILVLRVLYKAMERGLKVS